MSTPVLLAVDLGTTHTVAVVARGDQPPRPLLFDGSPLLPSGVFLDTAGDLHTGRDAQRMAAREPDRFEPHPKRRIDDGTVLLGDQEVRAVDLLAATLRRVAEEATGSGLNPTETVLTHPADWGPVRRSLLEQAAADAGFDSPSLLPEPIAAAAYCTSELDGELPDAVAVFDFGGGTLDVAVLQPGPDDRWRPVAVGGLDDLGGLDIDHLLVSHLGRLIGFGDRELWDRLDRPVTGADRRDRLAFWAEVRAAKEMLSRSSTAPVALPVDGTADLHLTRDELNDLADPLLARAVDETRRTIERAGIESSSLSTLLLVGGTSRMPRVATRLHARLGIAPTVPEQPELPVAYGALLHLAAEEHAESEDEDAEAPVPPTLWNYSPQPVERPEPEPIRAMSETSPQAAPTPKAGAARSAAPTITPPRPDQRTPRSAAWTGTAVALAVVLLIGIALVVRAVDWGGLSDGPGNLGSGAGTETGDGGEPTADEEVGVELERLFDHRLDGAGAAAVALTGETVFVAQVGVERTEITALTASDGTEVWSETYELEPSDLSLTVVEDLLIVDAESSATDDGDDMRAAVSLDDGELLWKQPWEDRTDVAYFGTDLVLEQHEWSDAYAGIRLDLSTGEQVWRKDSPESLHILDDPRFRAAAYWDDDTEDESRTGTVPSANGSLHDNLTAGDRIVDLRADAGEGIVRDTADGGEIESGPLPLDDELWTVYEDMVIGKLSNRESPGRDVLAAYSLDGLDQEWEVKFGAQERIEGVKACGPTLVCAAIETTSTVDGTRTVAFDLEDGTEAWSIPVEWSVDQSWYTYAEGLVFGDRGLTRVYEPQLRDFEGNVRNWTGVPHSLEALRDGRAAVQERIPDGGNWGIAMVDLASGERTAAQDIGEDQIEQVTVENDLVVVLTADNGISVFSAAALN